MIRRKIIRSTPLIIALALVCPRVYSAAPTYLDYGIAAYKAGNYFAASQYLTEEIQVSPHVAAAHYYLGCSYQQLKHANHAKAEYQIALSLDPDGQIGRYASLALSQYERAAASNESAVSKIEEHITDQMQSAQSAVSSVANARAEAQEKLETMELAKLQKEANDTITEMKEAKYYDEKGKAHAVYSSRQIADTQASYDLRIANLKDAGTKNVVDKRMYGQTRNDLLRDSAANLAQRLKEQNETPGSVRLVPQGTNMYIRNFERSMPSPQPKQPPQEPELVASPQKLLLTPHAINGKPQSQIAPPGDEADQDELILNRKGSSAHLKVHGVLVH